jgi:hypothetical protein
MRLTSDEIEYLARKLVKSLTKDGHIDVETEARPRVIGSVAATITEELMVEDRLNQEVREVLLQHSSEMQRSNITYTEMFKMVKKKLAKEKGIIL